MTDEPTGDETRSEVLDAKDIVLSESQSPQILANEPQNIPFTFHGKGSEYFRIWIVNIVLSILTLGIYSAWAKVRRKQYFYGNTCLKSSSFEYLADPIKILKGRLIVASFFIIYSIFSNLYPIAGAFLSLVFLLAMPWLVVRSLSFNAVNSSIRNIRFGFHGTFSSATKVYVLWPLATVFTLGILFPYVLYRQNKFIVENTSYGKTLFTLNATAKDYYTLCFDFLMPMLIGIAVAVGIGFIFQPLSIITLFVLYLYSFAYFSVKTANLMFNATALSSHNMKANLVIKDYMLLVVTNTIGIALTLGLFNPWAKVRIMRYKADHVCLETSGDLDHFIADEQRQVSALGDEMSDFLDFDFGL